VIRILVTGWRDWPLEDRAVVWKGLDIIVGAVPVRDLPDCELMHGACPYGGVDSYTDAWGRERGLKVIPIPAQLARNGRILGPARNTSMVKSGHDVVAAFPGPGSTGTWDCLRKAVDARIKTFVACWYPGIENVPW
jgi:hypothetical protein